MRRVPLVILFAAGILAIQAGLTAALLVYGLEPVWVSPEIRWVKASLAAVNWAGGLALAFYLQARWGKSWQVIGVGGAALAVFYAVWYTSNRLDGLWIAGLVYGLGMAAFDILLIERLMAVAGLETAKAEDEAAKEREAQRQLALSEAETTRLRAERSLVKAQQPQAQITVTKRMKISGAVSASGAYACECGRTFALPQAFSAHARFCPMYAEKRAALVLEGHR